MECSILSLTIGLLPLFLPGGFRQFGSISIFWSVSGLPAFFQLLKWQKEPDSALILNFFRFIAPGSQLLLAWRFEAQTIEHFLQIWTLFFLKHTKWRKCVMRNFQVYLLLRKQITMPQRGRSIVISMIYLIVQVLCDGNVTFHLSSFP